VQTNSLNYTNADLREPCTPAMTSTMEYGVCRYHITRTITLSLSLSLSRELHRLKMLLFATLVNYAPIIKLLSSSSYRLSGERVASRRCRCRCLTALWPSSAPCRGGWSDEVTSSGVYIYHEVDEKGIAIVSNEKFDCVLQQTTHFHASHNVCVCVCLFARRKTHSTNLNHVARTFS